MIVLIDEKTTIRELAGRYPMARRVFEDFGIDYCCGGGEALEAAAARRGIATEDVRRALEAAIEEPVASGDERDWMGASLTELVDHIEAKHHAFMKAQLPRLAELGRRVMRAHGDEHGPMLAQLARVFDDLREEIEAHLMKEEQILFPYIRGIESARNNEDSLPEFHCGTIEHPIARMEQEHENAGHALTQMREITGGYALPESACTTFAEYYAGLEAMEADLHEHIHLENNVLFPRAVRLESEK